jgi:hypothetical protein
MKYVLTLSLIVLMFSGCRKDETIPTLTFSSEDRNWFIYNVGQQYTLKDSLGHSITYTVKTVSDSLRGEYQFHSSDSSWQLVARSEIYIATLYSDVDSIRIAFYKQFINATFYHILNSSILWIRFESQFPGLDVLTNGKSFTTLSINNFTYNDVTGMIPATQESDSWTFWTSGLYDQKFGIIEITDTNGIRWLRQN